MLIWKPSKIVVGVLCIVMWTGHDCHVLATICTLWLHNHVITSSLLWYWQIFHYKNIAGCGGKDEVMWRNSLGPRLKTNQSMDRFEYHVLQWKRRTTWMRSGGVTSGGIDIGMDAEMWEGGENLIDGYIVARDWYERFGVVSLYLPPFLLVEHTWSRLR